MTIVRCAKRGGCAEHGCRFGRTAVRCKREGEIRKHDAMKCSNFRCTALRAGTGMTGLEKTYSCECAGSAAHGEGKGAGSVQYQGGTK